MIKILVDNILQMAEKIKDIGSARYEREDLINAQGNNQTVQLIVEDSIYVTYSADNRVMATVNVDVLDNLYQSDIKQDKQDKCARIAFALVLLINLKLFNAMNVYDYSILTLSEYSNDKLVGVRLTLNIMMPPMVTVCDLDELYIEDKTIEDYLKKNDFEINLK